MGNRGRRVKKTFTMQSFTLLIFFIVNCSLLISSCGNPFVNAVLDPKTARFETNGGSSIESQTVYRYYPIKRPADPVKSGHTFDEWYTDNETFLEQWGFDTIPTTDITLYANWKVDDTEMEENTINIFWVDDAGQISIGTTGQPFMDNTVAVPYGEKASFSTSADYTDHYWTLYGNAVAANPDNSYTFDSNDKEIGKSYTIGLRVVKDDKYYFIQITVIVVI